jgi:hypothetical protein
MIENIILALCLAVLIGDVILLAITIPDALRRKRVTEGMNKVLEAMVKKAKEDGALPEDEAEAKEDNE